MTQGDTMADTIATTTIIGASDKVKLNPLTPFTGKRNEFVLFMQDVYIYLKVNWNIYDNDDKKISFILSEETLPSGNNNLSRQKSKNMNKIKPKNRIGGHTLVL
jgi:hypothetical protein